MRTTPFLLLVFPILIGSTNKSDSNFDPPNRNHFYYKGKIDKQEHHVLTFFQDSTFHITVPNNSGSCWTWGEHGGTFAINSDTISFNRNSYSTNHQEKSEIFVADSDLNLYRISNPQFMASNYSLKKWNQTKLLKKLDLEFSD